MAISEMILHAKLPQNRIMRLATKGRIIALKDELFLSQLKSCANVASITFKELIDKRSEVRSATDT